MREVLVLLSWQGQIALIVSVTVLIIVLLLLVACCPRAGRRIVALIERICQIWRS